MSTPASPIGIFDSGIGGLTVVREVIRQLPHERIIYFGDTARVPYGPKSPDTVRRYSHEIGAVPHVAGREGHRRRVQHRHRACAAHAAARAVGAGDRRRRAGRARRVSPPRGAASSASSAPPGRSARAPTSAPFARSRRTRTLSRAPARCSCRSSRKGGSTPKRHGSSPASISRRCRRRGSTRSSSAARTIRCSSRCSREILGADVVLIDSAQETAAETARALARRAGSLAERRPARTAPPLHRVRRARSVSTTWSALSRLGDRARRDTHPRLIRSTPSSAILPLVDAQESRLASSTSRRSRRSRRVGDRSSVATCEWP